MFIYAFIHLHINILKPSRSQCLNSILSQLFCINFSTRIKSSQFTSHSTCFFRYTCIYIYIQYQINILKPLQCPQLQRAQGYVQLAPARKLAWVFVFWLALAQVFPCEKTHHLAGFLAKKLSKKDSPNRLVFWRGGGFPRPIYLHAWNVWMWAILKPWQIYTCVSLRSVMHSKYRIMPPPHPPPTPYMLYLPSQHLVSNIQTCIAQNR